MIVAPSPQYAVLGTSVELQCAITAEGVTIIDTWAVGDDTNFDPGLNILSPVEMGDEGMYTCRLHDENTEMEDFDVKIDFRITGEVQLRLYLSNHCRQFFDYSSHPLAFLSVLRMSLLCSKGRPPVVPQTNNLCITLPSLPLLSPLQFLH